MKNRITGFVQNWLISKKKREKKKDDDDDDAAYKQDHSSIRVTFYKIDVTNESKLNS